MFKAKISILVMGIFFALSAISVSADEGILKVTAKTGKVLVRIAPSTEWSELSVGKVLNTADSVKTMEDGKATLEFPNKSSITLKPKTEISIDELVWNDIAKKVNINMTAGELKTIIKKVDAPSEFKIRTPTAISGARGTIFYVVVFENGTGVYVEEGLIEFLNTISGESYSVYQGMSSESRADGSTTTPHELTKDEVNSFIAGYDMGLVAEPYTEPEGDRDADEISAPDVIQETAASQI